LTSHIWSREKYAVPSDNIIVLN